MPTLRSGAVIVGAYATKIRKTLFAQLKDKVKSKEMSAQEVARAAGEINKMLYVLFVEKLRLDKGDVVRITIDYDVTPENQIVWNYESLKVEAYRKVPEDEVNRYLKEILEGIQKVSQLNVEEYVIEKLRETKLGDIIFDIKRDRKIVGVLIATNIDDEVIVRGAIKDPPFLIKKQKIKFEESIENSVAKSSHNLLRGAIPTSEEEAEKTIKEIREL
ncbi:MAG: DUF2258 domain-containing protein [Candidatus Aenigmatarchaeota archaeon]